MEGARPATETDRAAVDLIASRVAETQRGARGGEVFLQREAGRPPAGERLAGALGRQDRLAMVGTYDEVVFGYGLARVEALDDGRRLAVVTDLVVEPEARRVGIGEAIMTALVDQAQELGCMGVDAWALPGDRETKNFFESFGLKARLLTVHRSLAP